MRFLALIVVVAIVYVAYGRAGKSNTPQNRVNAAQREVAQVMQQTPPPQQAAPPPAQPNGGLRAPIDRTRAVMEMVKGRN
jgi:hypothetical protein